MMGMVTMDQVAIVAPGVLFALVMVRLAINACHIQ
jgi:hypothetical protein